MSAPVLQRPIGFNPAEISAMVNEVVVEQHAEEAAFLWTQRDRAVLAPNYRLKDLIRLDERVEAHLDGLRIAGQFGWQLCKKALEEPEAGEVFAAAVLAFGSSDLGSVDAVLKPVGVAPELQCGLISALGWLPFSGVERFVRDLADSDQPAHRRIAIAACAAHRRDPGQPLVRALSDPDLRLRARALKACGELGKTDLVQAILPSLSLADNACRFFAASSAARLGNRSPQVLGALRELALKPNRFSEHALDVALRVLGLQEEEAWQRQLRNDPTRLRLAAKAVGTIGDPALVGDLLELMKVPPVARTAGASFSLLTGVDLAFEDLGGEPPEGFEAGPNENPEDATVEMDPEESLPWPAPERVAAWWKKNGQKFAPGRRFLLGKEISDQSLRDALVKGYQLQRAAAALELGCRQPAQPLFEIRARGGLQLQLL